MHHNQKHHTDNGKHSECLFLPIPYFRLPHQKPFAPDIEECDQPHQQTRRQRNHAQCDNLVGMVSDDPIFQPLKGYLATVPSVRDISSGFSDDGYWWVKFTIDIEHPLAWSVVQELGHVLNYVSLEERLPTVFMPVSPPPYMNGGPREFLSWVIESKNKDFQPKQCAEWIEGRLPRPVTDIEHWE